MNQQLSRKEQLSGLREQKFDLCIIGAGASGAGCALDAVLRGWRVALIEQSDFASGTSSRSTKLIHGGVRYLEQAFRKLDFAPLKQVRHGLSERKYLLANAPHLARPLALVTPIFNCWEGLYFSIGLKIYDFFAGKENYLPRSKWLSRASAKKMIPHLTSRATGAVLYYDGQLDDARYAWALTQTAIGQGAIAANHVQLIDFQKDKSGKLVAARVRDQLSGEQFDIEARLFLNCTGATADAVRWLANPELPPRILPSKGVHAVFPFHLLDSQHAMLIPKTPDGRVVFAIPFQGKTIIGTTDEPCNNPESEPLLLAHEVQFLIETVQPFFDKDLKISELTAGFGGLRPLILPAEKSAETKKMVRDHEVELDHLSNLVSLLGGKWTTYRLMAADAIDFCEKLLAQPSPCRTACFRLAGAENYDPLGHHHLRKKYLLPDDVALHLHHNYGSRAELVMQLVQENPSLGERIHPDFPFLKAEICYAARFEMAATIRDFLAHRIRLEVLDWQAAAQTAPVVADTLARELQWSDDFRAEQLENYVALLKTFKQSATDLPQKTDQF